MTRHLLPLIFLLFLTLQAGSQPPAPFEYGSRPDSPVFDPTGLLPPEISKKLGETLNAFHANEGVDVLVIVDSDFEKAPPEIIAKRFSDAWSKSIAHCVILHIPGREGTPWIFPSGDLFQMINPEAVSSAIEAVKRRANAEPVEANKVRIAATESADLLRFWLGSAIEKSREIQLEQEKIYEQEASAHRKKKFMLIGAIAGAIPVLSGLIYLIYASRQRRPLLFPSRSWQPRLGAPYGGGNNIIVKIGKSSHSSHSHHR